MNVIYVFTATEAEARAVPRMAFQSRKPNASREAILGANRVRLFITGIGPQAASAAVRSVAAGAHTAEPRAIMVAGTCGALMAGLPEGAIVTYAECLCTGSRSTERVTCDAELTERIARTLRDAGIESKSVCGVTSPVVVATRPEKKRLAATGGSVVDMESYVILSAAQQMAIPAVVLRVVSDGADREFPDFTRAVTPEGRVKPLTAAAIAATSPLATARLMLAQRRALRRLSLALKTVLGSSNWPDAS